MNDSYDGLFDGFVLGMLFVIVFCISTWHLAESKCQHKFDVADCSLSINVIPVTPKTPTEGE